MKIVTMSRREIEAFDWNASGPCAAICIAYPNGRLHRIVPMGPLLKVLHVRFSDCDGESKWSFPENKDDEQKPIPMTRGQAIDILDFVRGLPQEVETLYIACYGGVSRSRGVAAGICAVLGLDDTHIYAQGVPNAWCKTLLIREAATQRKEGSS